MSLTDMDVRRQYELATTLQTALVMVGVLLLGVGAAYYSAQLTAINAGCTISIVNPDDPCTVLLRSLSDRAVKALGAGVFALVVAGGMEYGLRRVAA